MPGAKSPASGIKGIKRLFININMNADEIKKLYKAMSEALELKEKGEQLPEILNLFPEHREELEEMFKNIEDLAFLKESIKPTEGIFEKIVANEEISRLLREDEAKHFSLFQSIELFSQLLTAKKVYVGIAVIVLIFGISGFYYRQLQEEIISPVVEKKESEELAINNLTDNNLTPKNSVVLKTEGTVSFKEMESDLTDEINGLSVDLDDLEGFGNDDSFENLETIL